MNKLYNIKPDDLQAKLLNDLLKQKQIKNIIKSEMAKAGMADVVSNSDIMNKSFILSEVDKTAIPPPQLQGESDDDYKARVEIWNNQQELKIQKLVIDERNKFKKNLLKIMNEKEANEVLSDTNIQEDNITKINKYWASFEKALKNNFDKISLEDFKSFMDKFIDLIDKPNQIEAIADISKQLDKEFENINEIIDEITKNKEKEKEKEKEDSTDDGKIKKFTGDELYRRFKVKSEDKREEFLRGDLLKKIKINKIDSIKDEELKKIILDNKFLREIFLTFAEDNFDTTKKGINTVKELSFQPNNRVKLSQLKKIAEAGASYRNTKLEDIPEDKWTEEIRNKIDKEGEKLFGFGRGRKKEVYDTVPFGRYEINKNKLDRNIISVHHMNSLNPVKFFKNTHISDDMKDLIYFISEKHKFNNAQKVMFNNLSDDEKELFKMLFEKSGLSKAMDIKLETNKYNDIKKLYNDLKERYELLDGEQLAGNDSPKISKELKQVIKELKKVITFMIKYNLISKRDGTNMILSL